MAKPKKKLKANKSEKEVGEIESDFSPLDVPVTWQSGRKVSVARGLIRKDGVKGISIKLGTKNNYLEHPRFGKTIWIDEELDLSSWFSWFTSTVKQMYFRYFSKDAQLPEGDVQFYKTKTETLTKELAETQKKLEEAELKAEDNKRIVEYAQQVKDKTQKFEATLLDFNKMINDSIVNNKGDEEPIKTFIKDNPWLLGLECSVEAKNQDIDIQAQIDLHVKTKYNQDRIFELKSPNLRPFQRKSGKEDRRLNISPALSEGMSELVLYLERTNLYSHSSTEGTYPIAKPTGCIIVGYDLAEEEKKFLKYLNFHLYPHIEIFTYKQLIEHAERELSIIKRTNEPSIVK